MSRRAVAVLAAAGAIAVAGASVAPAAGPPASAYPAVTERIDAIGGVPAPMSPAEFAAKAAEDSKRFGAIIRERRIVGD